MLRIAAVGMMLSVSIVENREHERAITCLGVIGLMLVAAKLNWPMIMEQMKVAYA